MINTLCTIARVARKVAAKATRRAIERALVAASARVLATGELVTITDALTALDADDEIVTRFASPAGKAVKAAYVAAHGKQPARLWVVRNDRPIRVFVYDPRDTALTAGFAAYKRTAHLIPAVAA